LEYFKKGNRKYVLTACVDCSIEKAVRMDVWQKINKTWRCLSCAKKKTFNDNPDLKKQVINRFVKHGESRNKNQYGHWLYSRWQKMKARCKRWPTYLAKGIKVCPEWESDYMAFKKWAEDNGAEPSLELDRIDNSGDYHPYNCRWVTHQQNCSNR
jgi:hypothetical protein